MVFEGDASLLMNVQELDTLARSVPRLLVVVMNDGALGAEFHKLGWKGHDPALATAPSVDFATLAAGFGLAGETVTDLASARRAAGSWANGERPGALLLDLRISPNVMSRPYRRLYTGSVTRGG